MSLLDIIDNNASQWSALPSEGGRLEWTNEVASLPGLRHLVIHYWVPLSHMHEHVKIVWSDGPIEDSRDVQKGALEKLRISLSQSGPLTFRVDEFSTEHRPVKEFIYIDDETYDMLVRRKREPPQRFAILVE